MAGSKRRFMPLRGGVLFVVGMLLAGSLPGPRPALANPGTLYVAGVSGNDANTCSSTAPCRTIQRAVDLAAEGDAIYIATLDDFSAPVYTGSGTEAVIALDKGLTLRGGYAYSSFFHTWLPSPVPAPVDGEGARRALYVSGNVTPTLELLILRNGSATAGGNVYVQGSHIRLLGLLIQGGSADRGGGLYLQDSAALLSGVVVRDNQAGEGGGLYLEGGQVSLLAGVIQENSAQRGGGLFGLDCAAYIVGAAVYSNTASVAGGGIYLDGPLTINPLDIPIVSNTYIRHNQAPAGAGLYLRLAIAGLVNNVIADNVASGHGGGIYLYASSPQGFHNTVAQNAGSSGIYLTHQPGSWWPPLPPIPSLPTITNTLIVSESIGVYVDSTGWFYPLENRATLRGTLWDNTVDMAGPGEFDIGSTNVYSHPLFTCAGDIPLCPNPYHLQETSPAVDAGVPIALTLPGTDLFVDIDGQLRPSGAGYDIGADEVVQPGGVWLLPPLSLRTAQPGETVTHTHWLLNSGTTTDTYTLTLSATPGWSDLLTPWPITLRPQTTATVEVQVTIPPTATAGMTETAVLRAISWQEPLRQAYALEETTVITTPSAWADLSLDKQADTALVPAGEAVRFTLTLTNAGPFSQTIPVTLSDTAAPTEAIAALGAPPGCQTDAAAGEVTCTLELPAGTSPVSVSLDLVITTTGTYTGPLWNGALLSGAVPDPYPANNAAQALVLVMAPARPEIVVIPEKMAVTLTVGLSTTRTLTVANRGGADLDWWGVESPPIPWLSQSPLGGTIAPSASVSVAVHYDAAGLESGVYTGTLQVWSNDPLEPVVPVALTLTVVPSCAPVSGLVFSWQPLSPLAGQAVTFTAAASGSEPLSFSWNLGDGTAGQGAVLAHAYALAGTYGVTLTATNRCGEETLSHSLVVLPAAPAYRLYLPLVERIHTRP